MKLKAQKQKQILLKLLFWSWFAFLSMVFLYTAILQSDRDVHQTQSFLIQSLNDIADKAEIIARNEQRSNRFFIVSHQRLLEKFIIRKLSEAEFWEAIKQNFEPDEGVLIYSEYANPVFEKNSTSGALRRVISLPELKNKPAMGLSLKFFDTGVFYYAYSRFYVGSKAFYLIIEKPFKHEFLDYIASSTHQLEFSLMNAGVPALNLSPIKNQKEHSLFASQQVPNLGWEMAVYGNKDYPLALLVERLKIGVGVLAALLLLYFILKVFLRFSQKRGWHLGGQNTQNQGMLDYIDEIIISTDSKGVIDYANHQAAQFLGKQTQNFVGSQLHEIYPDERAIWNKPIRGKKDLFSPSLTLSIHGTKRVYEQIHQVINIAHNDVRHLWILRNVTEKKQRLDLLNKTKQRYQSIFENSGFAYLLLKKSGGPNSPTLKIFDANNAALKLFNFTDIKEHARDFIKQNKKLVKDIISQKQSSEFQTSITDLSGRVKEVWAHVHFDESNPKALLLTLFNASEHSKSLTPMVDSEKHYRLVADNINEVMFFTDTSLTLNFISGAVENMLGHTSEYLIANGLKELFALEARDSLIEGLNQQLATAVNKSANHNAPIIQDVRLLHANGQTMLIELQTSVLFEDGRLIGILGVCRDVSDIRESQQQLMLAAKVFESSNESIIITDNMFNIVNFNQAFINITGYKKEQVMGKNLDFLISSDVTSSDFIDLINQRLQETGYWQGEIFYVCSKGHRRIGWAGVSMVKDENQNTQSLIMIISDVTERKAIEERIHHLAYYDVLTGLPNRTHLHEKLNHILASAEKEQSNVVLLFIDLDRFKPINDSMGHPAGDQVLKQVADRLRDSTKYQDLVCRIGGDEFTVIIESQGTVESATENAMHISERLLENLNAPYFINNRELFLSASIGIAIYPSDGLSVSELIKNSDLAMYHAKSNGRGNIQFFNKAMNQVAIESMELENDLRQALSRGEFELYYQPQYSSVDCSMIAVEALIRWHHPTKGMVYPGLFIDSLEETGMIVEVGCWVLEQACLQFAQWLHEDTDSHLEHVSVNVSALQFKQQDFLEQIQQALNKSEIEPSNLEIELTESVLVDDIEYTFKMLSALQKLGVKIAIDDFGTGYCSLNYLKNFPFNTLKIDQNFVRELPQNQDDAQITQAIIALAKNMKVDVIAEGVETKEQLDFLSEQNCNKMQGYLFEPPLPAAQVFKRFLDNKHLKVD